MTPYNVTKKSHRSLILYLETCMVDGEGRIDSRRMNREDFDILIDWHKSDFVTFWRLKFECIENSRSHGVYVSHLIDFSPEAWNAAHTERRARSLRMITASEERGRRIKTGMGGQS